jgi:hypothetical protein
VPVAWFEFFLGPSLTKSFDFKANLLEIEVFEDTESNDINELVFGRQSVVP